MKRFLSILFFSIVFSVSYARNDIQIADRQDRSWYGEELFLRNIRFGSENPVSIAYTPYVKLTDFQVSADLADGDFCPVDEASKANMYNLNIYGIRKTEKTSFEGSIGYHNHSLEDSRWNGTVLTSERNPFIIADSLRYDSLTNDFDKESFFLNGGFAYRISDKLNIGVRAYYSVGSKADQADPRIETHGSRTTINPGMEYQLDEKWSLGLSMNAEMYHESVDVAVKDNMISAHNTIFIFRELGKYETKDAIGYKRYYKGKKFGGSLQSIYKSKRIQNYLELNLNMNSEDAEDGGAAYSYLGGDFKETSFALRNRLMFSCVNAIHNITVSAEMITGKGIWHKQALSYDSQANKIWTVLLSEQTHKRSDMNLGINYRLDFMQSGYNMWTAKLDAGYSNVNVNEYPDGYNIKYSLANIGVSFARRWSTKKYCFSTSVGGKYQKSMNELEYDIPLVKPADLRVLNSYFLPKYNYDSSDLFGLNISADVLRKVVINDNQIAIRASIGLRSERYMGDYWKLKDTDRTQIVAGLNFIF